MLPLIIQHLPVVVSEAPAPSLAAFVGSVLMTASLPHNSHPAASVSRSALKPLIRAQQLCIQAAWPSALQDALTSLLKQAQPHWISLNPNSSQGCQDAEGSAPAQTPTRPSGKKARKKRSSEAPASDGIRADGVGTATPASAGSRKKHKTPAKVHATQLFLLPEQAMSSGSAGFHAAQIEEWADALRAVLPASSTTNGAVQHAASGSAQLPAQLFHDEAQPINGEGRMELDALKHLASVCKGATPVLRSTMDQDSSAAMARLLLQASQTLIMHSQVTFQASPGPPSERLEVPEDVQSSNRVAAARLHKATMAAATACLSALASLLACDRHAAAEIAQIGGPVSRLLVLWISWASACCSSSSSQQRYVPVHGSAFDDHLICQRPHDSVYAIAHLARAVMGLWIEDAHNEKQDLLQADAVDLLMACTINNLQQVRCRAWQSSTFISSMSTCCDQVGQ